MNLSPVDVATALPSISESLARAKKKTGERWTPEHVLIRIARGGAILFELSDEKHLAYLVLERIVQGESPWVNVWILEGEGMTDEVNKFVVDSLDRITREVGAVAWRCTGRKGWDRALGGAIKPVAVVYERVVL